MREDDTAGWPPIATWTLVAANVAVAWTITGFVPTESTLAPLLWSRETMQAGEWERLVLSMFAHGGIVHLAFNMIALVSMGGLERALGTPRFVAIYLAAGVAGGIAHVIASPIPVVGASGAIFGLLGVVLVLDPRLELNIMFLPVPAVVALTLYLSVVLAVPAFSDALPIAHWAHLGGMFAGMAGGFVIRPAHAARHLVYIVGVFGATLLLVSALTAVDLDELRRLFEDEGLVAVVVRMWLVWVALIAIWVLVAMIETDEGMDEHATDES